MFAFAERLFGPMVGKELAALARKRWFFNLRVTVAIVAVLLVAQVYLQSGPYGRNHRRNMARLAYESFGRVIVVEYLAVALLTPAIMCGAIARERERQTLPLLFATHLSSREIIVSKLISRCGLLLLLCLAVVPIVALLQLFGGVDARRLVVSQGLIALTIAYLGSFALYCSATSATTMQAMVKCYLGIILVGVAMPAAMATMFRTAAVLVWAILVNPGLLLAVLWEPGGSFRLSQLAGGSWINHAAVLTPLALSLLFILLAFIALRRYTPKLFRRSIRQRNDRLFGIWRIGNPMWLRSRSAAVYDRGFVARGLLWLAFGFFAVVGAISLWRPPTPGARIDYVQTVTIVVMGLLGVTMLLAAGSFVGDRQRGFLEQALTTPMTGREIVDGTLLALADHLKVSVVAALAIVVLPAATPGMALFAAPWFAVTLLLCAALVATFGVAASLTGRSLTAIIAMTLPAAYAMLMGLPLYGAMHAPYAQLMLIPAGLVFAVGLALEFHRRDWWRRHRVLRNTALAGLVLAASMLYVAGCWVAVASAGFWLNTCIIWAAFVFPVALVASLEAHRRLSLGAFIVAAVCVQQFCVALPQAATVAGHTISRGQTSLGSFDWLPSRMNDPGEFLSGMRWIDAIADEGILRERQFRSFFDVALHWTWMLPVWWPALAAFWLGTIAAIWWMRRWLILHFDRLAGRMP